MLFPLLVLAAALLGGAASWLARWNERRLHVALALSTGTFLGAVFLHLLPEVAALGAANDAHALDHAHPEPHVDAHGEDAHGPAEHGHAHSVLWLWVLAGVLLVHMVEAVFLRTTDREGVHRHQSVSLVTMAGVSVHAASAGLGLSALDLGGTLGASFVVAFLTHKAFESFAMANVLELAHFSRAKIAVALVLFSLVTPACMLAGGSVLGGVSPDALAAVTALAAGTFLYVCIAELLPEVFHHPEDNLAKFAFLGAGIGVSVLLVRLGA